jgi:hypothetical protein
MNKNKLKRGSAKKTTLADMKVPNGMRSLRIPGYPFRLTGANEPIIEKHILKCQKIRNKNSACTS